MRTVDRNDLQNHGALGGPSAPRRGHGWSPGLCTQRDPAVVSVDIALIDERMLFRLGTSGALAAIYAGQMIALEVHAVDNDVCCGWSLNIEGMPLEIWPARASATGESVHSWLRADNSRLFSLGTDDVEGRRLTAAPPTTIR